MRRRSAWLLSLLLMTVVLDGCSAQAHRLTPAAELPTIANAYRAALSTFLPSGE